jgi:hypothetical protein
LVGGGGVVQQDQQAFAGGVGAVERGAGVKVGGLVIAVDAQGGEEVGQHVGRVRGFAGTEAAQVCGQLSVGEAVQVAVGPGEREPGLADPAGAADRGDHRRRAPTLPAAGRGVIWGGVIGGREGAVERGQLVDAADEVPRCADQLPRRAVSTPSGRGQAGIQPGQVGDDAGQVSGRVVVT